MKIIYPIIVYLAIIIDHGNQGCIERIWLNDSTQIFVIVDYVDTSFLKCNIDLP